MKARLCVIYDDKMAEQEAFQNDAEGEIDNLKVELDNLLDANLTFLLDKIQTRVIFFLKKRIFGKFKVLQNNKRNIKTFFHELFQNGQRSPSKWSNIPKMKNKIFASYQILTVCFGLEW